MEEPRRSIRQLIEDLQPQVVNLLLENWSENEILAFLREEGCTPLVAKNILAKARGAVGSRNRLKGLIITAGGVLCVIAAQYTKHAILADELHLRGRAGGKAALLAMVGTPLGTVVILVGLYYLFFGKSVAAVEDNH